MWLVLVYSLHGWKIWDSPKIGSCNQSYFLLSFFISYYHHWRCPWLWLWKQSYYGNSLTPSPFLPGWLLRAKNDCWELCFVTHVCLDGDQTQTTTNTQTVTHITIGYCPTLWGLSRSLSYFSETTSQPSGFYGPCSTRTIQTSRCCLSGPAANTAWWDKCT